jgi:hypothetical protein
MSNTTNKELLEKISALKNNISKSSLTQKANVNNLGSLKELKEIIFTPDRNINKVYGEGFKQIKDIFKKLEETLKYIDSAKKELNDEKINKNVNKQNYLNYLKYIEKIIRSKLYLDLKIADILIGVFGNTDNIQNSLKQLSRNLGSNISTLQPPTPQLPTLPIVNNVKDAVNNCSNSIKTSLNSLILELNSQNGGEFKYFIKSDNININKTKLNEIKKAYEDGFENNKKSFTELCDSIKTYLETLNNEILNLINIINQ